MDLLAEATAMFDYTRALRRDLHRHPELGFQEVRTAGIVAQELAALGLEVQTGIAQTGVAAVLEGELPGPTALVRFDMDALPVQETTGAEYASLTPGVMHACGHDGHVAVGLTVARLLHQHRAELRGAVKFMFQPAEEGLGGAEQMIAGGVLEGPRPDYALALHLWNEKPLGVLGISPGPVMAAADIVHIEITGRGGHAALPHLTFDPLAAAAQVVGAVQTIVARNVSPLDTAVVSITQFHAGDAFNVIPAKAALAGTLRTYRPETRRLVIERLEQIVAQVPAALGCRGELAITPLTAAVINDPQVTSRVQRAAAQALPEAVIENDYRSMVSEDMAAVLERIPGCYFYVGSANPGRGLNFGHHHPQFDFDEDVLPRAAAVMAGAVLGESL